jgi:hypothetical protein
MLYRCEDLRIIPPEEQISLAINKEMVFFVPRAILFLHYFISPLLTGFPLLLQEKSDPSYDIDSDSCPTDMSQDEELAQCSSQLSAPDRAEHWLLTADIPQYNDLVGRKPTHLLCLQ